MSPCDAPNGNTLFHRNDRRFNAMVVAFPSCAHRGPLEFPPPGTDLTTQEMSSTISLLMAMVKTFIRNPRLTSISRCILIHVLHFRSTNLAYLCRIWSESRSFFRGHAVLTIFLKLFGLKLAPRLIPTHFKNHSSLCGPLLTARTES
jgi:hypothetical protein